jgi:antitoxin component of MazEF toxin-antitoxin module
MVKLKVSKIGDSLGVILTEATRDALHVAVGDAVYVSAATEVELLSTRRNLIVGELPEDILDAIRSSEMSPEHAHLNSLLDD